MSGKPCLTAHWAVSVLMVLAGAQLRAQSDWFARAAAGPAARSQHGVALDAARNAVLLFGGEVQGQPDGSTWTWNGTAWAQRHVTTNPSPRTRFGLAPWHGHGVLLFGGLAGPTPSGEAWLWDGTGWALQPSGGAAARHHHCLAEGPETRGGNRGVVMYGGLVNGQPDGNMFLWTGTAWQLRASGLIPGARYAHAMVYDAARNTTVMFGGLAAGGQLAVNDTWEWNGTAWLQRGPLTRPPARYGHAMAFEPVAGRVVMFGGNTAAGLADDVWEWDGHDWQRRAPAHTPPARADHAMATDPATGRVLLFGGAPAGNVLGDTWTYGPLHLAHAAEFGSGCAGLALRAVPGVLTWLGDGFLLRVQNLVPVTPVFVLFGASNTSFAGIPLPVDLTGAGMAGCHLYASMEWIDVTFSLDPGRDLLYLIPNSPDLLGAMLFHQALAIDRSANPLGVTASNGLQFRIGSH